MSDDICCSKLTIIKCGDTDEHNHFICSEGNTPVSHDTIEIFCMDNWDNCIQNKGWKE